MSIFMPINNCVCRSCTHKIKEPYTVLRSTGNYLATQRTLPGVCEWVTFDQERQLMALGDFYYEGPDNDLRIVDRENLRTPLEKSKVYASKTDPDAWTEFVEFVQRLRDHSVKVVTGRDEGGYYMVW